MPGDGLAAVGEVEVVVWVGGVGGKGASVVGVGEEDALGGGDGVCEVGDRAVGCVFGAGDGDGVVFFSDADAEAGEERLDGASWADEFGWVLVYVEVVFEVALVDCVVAGLGLPCCVISGAAWGVFLPCWTAVRQGTHVE